MPELAVNKKRLIFTFLYKDGYFYLSRNFNLQKVGDVLWLKNRYGLRSISNFIDEVIILNLDSNVSSKNFLADMEVVLDEIFVPVGLGGGINTTKDIDRLFLVGADRIIFNSSIFCNPQLPMYCVQTYGSNASVGSLDFIKNELSQNYTVFNRKNLPVKTLRYAFKIVNGINFGEIIINSVAYDGLGAGVDYNLYWKCSKLTNMRLIPSGGADSPETVLQAFRILDCDALSLTHLFNFIEDGVRNTRRTLIDHNIDIVDWDS